MIETQIITEKYENGEMQRYQIAKGFAWSDISFSIPPFSKEAYAELRAPVRLIQTHMPSQRTDKLGIKSTGPLKDEFNILCLDLFIRTGKHEFVFVNSQNLNAQAKSPNHLQQNYTVDILL